MTIRIVEQKVIHFLFDRLPFDHNVMHALVHNHKFGVDHDLDSYRDVNKLGSKIEILVIGFDV